ncbi:MAG: TIGR03118 family protein [Terriglobia bacterium]
MRRHYGLLWWLSALVAATPLLVLPSFTYGQTYLQTNLVSNSSSIPAVTIDPNLVNAWGLVQGPTTPFWVSDQGTNKATLYNGAGTGIPLVVSVPTATHPPNGPTGMVFDVGGAGSFPLPTSSGATVSSLFIFANLNGQISGWNPGSTGGFSSAVVAVPASGASYTGLAINATGSLLYAANDKVGGGINVFNSAWMSQGTLPPLSASGITLPSNYAPYNVTDINGTLFLAYSGLCTSSTGCTSSGVSFPIGLPVPGEGNGAIIEYDPTTMKYSELVAPTAMNGLNVPWGFALAPSTFGKFSNDLLVGDFGSGWISAYNPTSGAFLGFLDTNSGMPLENGGLWTLLFGNGAAGTSRNTLYITAGGAPHPFQTVGWLAAIEPTPEPATLLLFGVGLLALGFIFYRKQRRARV